MEGIEQKVDEVFAEWDHTVTPGCALAVVKDEQVIYSRGYGIANLEYGIPITPQTVFHIASISKHFAALAVTLLAHEGKLSLDDDVRKYVPEVPDFGETITLRHLIHHTSGLRDQWELLILAGWRMDDVITMEDILDLVSKQQELNFKPGDNHVYCNTGYTLLSFVVQRVTGQSMRDFCAERMFNPLGMKHTHFHDDHTMLVTNRAYSYEPVGYHQYKHSVLSYANVGATSLFTTVEDLARWDAEFYTGAVFGKDVIAEMHTLGKLNNGEELEYAYGLRIASYKGLKIVEHSGGDAGYRTHMLRFPEQHFSVIVFSNLGTVAPGMLAHQVADLYLADQINAETDEVSVQEMAAEKLTPYAGIYYNAADQSTQRLEMRADRLFVMMGPGLELESIGENEFRAKLYPDARLKFMEDEEGLRLLIGSGGYGKATAFRRMQVETPSIEDLRAYVGVYLSPELDSKFSFCIEEDHLLLCRRKYGKVQMIPTIKDGFTTAEFPVDMFFYRDDAGQVAGFRLSAGRVKKLNFIKQ